jgi:D-alanyl-lipoteichoic acid acyltransferase DltB (MBOAT superfamily)
MLFNTVSYLAFLVISVVAYWVLPVPFRRWLLLAASLLFYGLWRIEFVFLIVFSAFVDYFFSLRIHEAHDRRRRRMYLFASLSTNIGLLIYFKYTYFILENAALITGIPEGTLRSAVGDIILPLGISFYTFLSISYTIDVYRRLFDPIRSFTQYLTYVMFWPHMIAGPILRAHELIPQLVRPTHLKFDHIAEGLRAILFGLFLKVGLADQLAPMVDDAFLVPSSRLGGLDVWTMAFAFGFQIYFDFAGYSMIAIGSARLLGIWFPENFNWPYLASSPREFWKRWHITLSSWIRDYLYLPLIGMAYHDRSEGGIEIQFVRTQNMARVTAALFLTWFIMGLWHGASWSFAFWGLWHAGFIFLYRITHERFDWIPVAARGVLGWAVTLPIVMLGWIPFRAHSLELTFALLGRVLDFHSYGGLAFRENFYLVVFLILVGMLGLRWLTTTRIPIFNAGWVRYTAETLGLAVAIFVVFIFLRPISQFIYFQF